MSSRFFFCGRVSISLLPVEHYGRAKGIALFSRSMMTFLERVCRALDDAGVGYAVVGGQAVALHGAVRGTIDVDIALRWTRRDLSRAEAALQGLGLVSRLPLTAAGVFEHRDEYIAERNLIAWNFYDPNAPMNTVDIIIPYDLTAKETTRIELSTGPVHVLSIKDLIAMKRASGRAQDLADIHALERLQ